MRHTKMKTLLAGIAAFIGILTTPTHSARAELILEEDVAIVVGNITELNDDHMVIETGDEIAIVSFYNYAEEYIVANPPKIGHHIAVEGYLDHYTTNDAPFIKSNDIIFVESYDYEQNSLASLIHDSPLPMQTN